MNHGRPIRLSSGSLLPSKKMRYQSVPVYDLSNPRSPSPKRNENVSSFFKVAPSISQWNTIGTDQYGISILSMRVDHHAESPWYIPSLHNKYSIGWNRSQELGFHNRPYACGLKFIGIARESVLNGFLQGGTGFLKINFKDSAGRTRNYGGDSPTSDKNDSSRGVNCYFMTNKDTGSEFKVRKKL
jgi:hypothetical protein